MGNRNHMDIILKGDVDTWNEWRASHLKVQPDLTRINLTGRDLRSIDFRGVGLFKANLSGCDLREANLRQSIAIKTNFSHADLTSAHVYGISAWDNEVEGCIQNDLVLTEPKRPVITVDNIQVAQFIHLLISNKNIRDVIETVGKKAVLILGRFTPKRKAVLNAVKESLRTCNYIPILFDFDVPRNRDITETVGTLAHLSRYVIADITDARSIPQELLTIVPHLPSVRVQPLILDKQKQYGMFDHFEKYPWVLPLQVYSSVDDLIRNFQAKVIGPLESATA